VLTDEFKHSTRYEISKLIRKKMNPYG